MNELFARYLETKNLAGSTRANYIATWNNQVKHELGNLKVTQIRPSHIKLLYARMTKDGYSHSVIKLIHNLLFPSFELAVDDDIIRKNPAKNALGDYGEPPKEKKALTMEQENARKEKRKAVLMPRVSAHSFRHTSCTRMAELGMDMKVVQYLMGHANIGITMEVYNHITDQSRIQKEIEKMV